MDEADQVVDPVEFQLLMVQVGIAMVAAGDAVDLIEDALRRIVDAYGVTGIQIALLPTSLFIQTGTGDEAHVEFISRVPTSLRLDQIDALYRLVKDLEHGRLSPQDGLERLRGVYRLRPTFSWPTRTLGHAILTAGLMMLLQPTPAGIAAAFVLGLFVGLMKLLNLPTFSLIFPIVASFVTAVLVFVATRYLHLDNPIRLLVAPLVTFLPGATLAIATMELAAGQMVSGASRLVSGVVQLALLGFGILAAWSLFGISRADLIDHHVAGLGAWAGWLGVLVFALGIYLHFSAPLRSLPWILLVLVIAFGAQSAGAALFGGQLSGFFGAAAMTPAVLWVETLPHGPPKLVTFLPSFWLLVPGAAGLITITEIVGGGLNAASRGGYDVIVTFVSIALGVLIGTALYRTAHSGYRRISETLPRW
jgi:uncharacterized membrane protein YjjP (DUF1212 family)